VLATGEKVIVFTAFTEGLRRHKATLGDSCVTLSGEDGPEARMAAVDAFQTSPDVRVMVANLIAGGVGITLTAGTQVIFQDLDWCPPTSPRPRTALTAWARRVA
jgi:SWI/SNF-related matrix-associated actin-dependent regulator 1 of chromatin subfamily A